MIKNKILTLTLGLILTVTCNTQQAHAEEWLECPKLNDARSYEGRKSLKYLTPGSKDWLFISKKDFMSDFSLKDETVNAFQNLHEKLKTKGTNLVLVVVPTTRPRPPR